MYRCNTDKKRRLKKSPFLENALKRQISLLSDEINIGQGVGDVNDTRGEAVAFGGDAEDVGLAGLDFVEGVEAEAAGGNSPAIAHRIRDDDRCSSDALAVRIDYSTRDRDVRSCVGDGHEARLVPRP